MAKYELSDEQIKNLIAIIDSTGIKGSEAHIILELKNALQKPIKGKNDGKVQK